MPTPTDPAGYPALIAANVREQMKAKGKRPVDLERDLQYSHATANRKLNAKVPWDTPELAAIANWLGVPVTKLTTP